MVEHLSGKVGGGVMLNIQSLPEKITEEVALPDGGRVIVPFEGDNNQSAFGPSGELVVDWQLWQSISLRGRLVANFTASNTFTSAMGGALAEVVSHHTPVAIALGVGYCFQRIGSDVIEKPIYEQCGLGGLDLSLPVSDTTDLYANELIRVGLPEARLGALTTFGVRWEFGSMGGGSNHTECRVGDTHWGLLENKLIESWRDEINDVWHKVLREVDGGEKDSDPWLTEVILLKTTVVQVRAGQYKPTFQTNLQSRYDAWVQELDVMCDTPERQETRKKVIALLQTSGYMMDHLLTRIGRGDSLKTESTLLGQILQECQKLQTKYFVKVKKDKVVGVPLTDASWQEIGKQIHKLQDRIKQLNDAITALKDLEQATPQQKKDAETLGKVTQCLLEGNCKDPLYALNIPKFKKNWEALVTPEGSQ